MSEQVRVGVVGTSWWADVMYLPALKSHSQASIAGICGRNRARAEEMAGKYGIPRVFMDYREMVAHGSLDAVVIAVPDDLHFPIAMVALEAGLHVLGEKPMAMNLEQARSMLAKAEAARVKHMVLYTWRWMPHFRLLQRLVSQGYVGKIYDAQFNYITSGAGGGQYQWKWDRQHSLGVLGGLGSHMIDLARLTVGEIARVQSSLSLRVPKPHPEGKAYQAANDSAALTIQFANGATGTIFVSAAAELGNRMQEQRVVLFGEDGTIEVDANFIQYTVKGIKTGGPEFQELPVPAEFLGGCNRDASLVEQTGKIFSEQSVGPRLFIDSILADRPVTPSFYEGMKNQAVIDAAFESDRTGHWTDVG